MLPKKFLTLLIVAVVAVAAFSIWFGYWVFAPKNLVPEESKYSAVYMTTGDIYFGELHWFPRPHLTNVWFLQKSVGADNQASFGVAPFRSAFWGPSNEIDLNPTQIVFYTRLRNDSQVAKVFDNPGLLSQPAPALPPSTSPSTPSSGPRGSGKVPPIGTFKGPSSSPPSGK